MIDTKLIEAATSAVEAAMQLQAKAKAAQPEKTVKKAPPKEAT